MEAIKASFEAVTLPASQVRHPTVSMRRAQDVSFPVIPDDRIWANVYSLIRFPDNPNEKDRNVTTATEEEAFANSATKTERALLRPVVIPEEDPRVAYYLMDTEEAAVGFKRRKLEKLPVDEGESPDHQLDQEVRTIMISPRSTFDLVIGSFLPFRTALRIHECSRARKRIRAYS